MNKDQVLSMTRFALTAIGSALMSKGYTDSGEWEAVTGGVIAIVSLVWSLYHHKKTQTNVPITVKEDEKEDEKETTL